MERIEGNSGCFALFHTLNGDLQMGSSLKQCYLPETVTWTKIPPVPARKAFLGETAQQLVDHYLLEKQKFRAAWTQINSFNPL